MTTPINQNLTRTYRVVESDIKTSLVLTGKISSVRLVSVDNADSNNNVYEITTEETQ